MITREFITAGRAIFTISNNKGDRYTYKVLKKEANGHYPDAWLVLLLTGPDNSSDYTYLGMLNLDVGSVTITRNSRFEDTSTPVRVIRWAFRLVWSDEKLPIGYTIRHEGRCGRCGRRLTVPESIDSGIGPECARAMADSIHNELAVV